MKNNFYFLMLSTSIFFNQFSIAQNLVPNPSFEDTIACPSTGGQIYRAVGWQNWGITPDYFNPCNSGLLGVPVNGWGNQMPVEGNSYAGIICNVSTVANVREFIGRSINQTLIPGQNYYVSFYVSLADDPTEDCAINKIGIKFSTVSYDSVTSPPLNNFANIFTNAIVSDKTNWTKITGWFVADSAYNYIMIGNFFDNANIDTLNCPTMSGTGSYYYIDMICVSTDIESCSLNDEVQEISNKKEDITLYPNPSDIDLNVQLFDRILWIKIYSVFGQLLYSQGQLNSNSAQVSTATLPNGVYFVNVLTAKKEFNSKIQVMHK